MRNRVFLTTVLLGLLAWPALSRGQDSPTAALPAKIAVINIQDAIALTAEGKKASAELQKKYQPRQDDLQRQAQEIQSLQDQLTRGNNTLSEEEKARLGREIETKNTLAKRTQEDYQAESQADSQEAIRRIGQKMVRVIGDYAQQNSLTLVVDSAQIPIYYAAKGTDITEEIVKRYDAANPVSASDTAAPSTPNTRPASRNPAASRPAATATKPPDKPKP